MDGLLEANAQMHMTDEEQQMHVHYVHVQNHGIHLLSNKNSMDDDHDDGATGGGEGMDGELHDDPGNISDNHGAMMVAGGDNDQLTLSFQGQVYVFDSVSPEKIAILGWVGSYLLYITYAVKIKRRSGGFSLKDDPIRLENYIPC